MSKKLKISISIGAVAIFCVILLIIINNLGISLENAVQIALADMNTTVNGQPISTSKDEAVYLSNDLTYSDEEDAFIHSVIHISQPGVYALSGTLAYGQVAVDLGEKAYDDKNAVVTLILNNANINCSVAPAIVFNNVYECSSTKQPQSDINTKKAGANIYIANDSVNNIKGSYNSLNKDNGAIYSKVSMNIDGKDDAILNVVGENEGIHTDMHLTINGGSVSVASKDTGIIANSKEKSVITINEANLKVDITNNSKTKVDAIKSNGWITINDGQVVASTNDVNGSCSLDAGMGIIINGGTLKASGNKMGNILKSKQNYAVFNFASKKTGGSLYSLKNEKDETVIEYNPFNNFSNLVMSSSELKKGNYTFTNNIISLEATKGDLTDKKTDIFEIVKGENCFNFVSEI